MAENFEINSDISPETGSSVGKNTGSDYSGDLAKDDGKDLNKNGGFAKAMSYDVAPPIDYSQHNPINDGNIVNVCEMPGECQERNREFQDAMQQFEQNGEAKLPASFCENLQENDLNQPNETTEQLNPGHQDIDPFDFAEDLGGGVKDMQDQRNAREENNDLIAADTEPKMENHCDLPEDYNAMDIGE